MKKTRRQELAEELASWDAVMKSRPHDKELQELDRTYYEGVRRELAALPPTK